VYERGARLLPRAAALSGNRNGSAWRHHLFVDETDRAHPANLERFATAVGSAKQVVDFVAYTFPLRDDLAEVLKRMRDVRSVIAREIYSPPRGLSRAAKFSLENGANFPDVELREKLCELPGCRRESTNCVCFAYERLRAFPIDVWIERVLKEKYFRGKESDAATIARTFRIVFGPHGGYAQQYLFITRAKHRRESNGIALQSGQPLSAARMRYFAAAKCCVEFLLILTPQRDCGCARNFQC